MSLLIDLHFGDIAFLKLGALIEEGREVAHDVVDRDAGRESDTTLELLALLAGESLLDFFLNHAVDGVADGGNVGAWDSQLTGLLEAG